MNVRRSIAVAAIVVAAPVLSSCGVNFGAPTDQVYNAAVGVDNRDSQVDVLNALVVTGEDGKGTIVAGLVNNDAAGKVRLTGISAGDPTAPVWAGEIQRPALGMAVDIWSDDGRPLPAGAYRRH